MEMGAEGKEKKMETHFQNHKKLLFPPYNENHHMLLLNYVLLYILIQFLLLNFLYQ